MKAYHNSVVLRNDGIDPDTFKVDLNAGITVPVTVRINSTQALASIFDLDEVATGNPLTTSINGNYAFKAADDVYDIIISEGTVNEVVLEKVEISESLTSLSVKPFDTISDAVNSVDATLMFNGSVINVKERKLDVGGGFDADVVLTSGVTPNTYEIVVCVGFPSLSIVIRDIKNVRQLGWDETGGLDNYNAMAHFVNTLGAATNTFDTIYTLNYFTTQWLAGEKFPLAFYGDSTTDGATTTGHVASFITGDEANFSSPITINNSPNSYPNKTDDWLNFMITSANLAIYNAGFDSMSLSNNFGNKAFHRVFYGFAGGLNNVDFSDVKGIALSWGTSDSINLDDIDTILDSYEWKMELLIVECFERGVQPFINDPVLNFQRTGSLVNGRQNDQSISIIESINQRLRVKYNIEHLSLRKPLENYAEKAYLQEKDFTEVLSADGVHPNDQGHTTIASWMTASLHPLVKRFSKEEEYRFTAGNPYPITLAATAGTDIWRVVDNTTLISRTSFFYRFDPVVNNEFMYRFFIFCEEPMDLTYNCHSLGNDQKIDDRIAKIEVTNFSNVSSRKGRFFSDNQGTGFPLFSGSHQLVARLKVGLNQINVTAPEDATYTQQDLGYLRVEPRDQASFISETIASGFATFELKTNHEDIKYIDSAPANSLIWSSSEFKRSEYHYTKNGESSKIHFTINTLHNREIAWNGNRTFLDYDCYNLLKFSGTSIELYRVNPTSNVDFTPVETLIGSATANVDLSTITDFEDYYITINHDLANTTIIIQRLRNSTGATSTLGTINLVTQATQPFAGGYSVGANKSATDGIPMLIKDISFDFVS